ncbi:hypothetical protein MASR2M48_24560 [Spirochaetota bacterium]
MNKDWINYPPKNKTTDIILTEKIAETFSSSLEIKSHLDFLESINLINVKIIGNSETFEVNGYRVSPVQLGEDYLYAYDISGFEKRALAVVDELKD